MCIYSVVTVEDSQLISDILCLLLSTYKAV